MMKNLTIGILIGFLLALSTNAFAAIGDTVTAVFAQFTYKVNGEAKPIDSPVLVYEGTSYLRTTDLANLLGFDVTYRADGRTIEFSGGPAPEPTPTQTPTPTTEQTQTPAAEQSTEPATSTETPQETAQEPAPTQPQPVEPTPTETATEPEAPAPDNTAACQAIRDKWNVKIYTYNGKNPKEKAYQQRLWTTDMNNELSASGCQ